MLLAGVSTRRVGELLDQIIDLPISAGQVSRLAKKLDAEVKQFHQRPLQDEFVYLLLDGIHLKSRGVPRLMETGLRRSKKRVILVAYGITEEGFKQLIDFRVANSESETAWRQFLWQLYKRGLTGRKLRLITTDGNNGLIAAVEEVYHDVRRQRCWFHKMQNVSSRVRKTDQVPVLKGLRKVYDAPNRRAAERAYVRWAKKWKDRYPKALECVDKDLEWLLNIYAIPEAQRKRVRTTNPIERCFREVRRRTRPIGTFVNDDSIERIIYGLISYLNRKFADRPCAGFRRKSRAA
jgi:transposase-like protein